MEHREDDYDRLRREYLLWVRDRRRARNESLDAMWKDWAETRNGIAGEVPSLFRLMENKNGIGTCSVVQTQQGLSIVFEWYFKDGYRPLSFVREGISPHHEDEVVDEITTAINFPVRTLKGESLEKSMLSKMKKDVFNLDRLTTGRVTSRPTPRPRNPTTIEPAAWIDEPAPYIRYAQDTVQAEPLRSVSVESYPTFTTNVAHTSWNNLTYNDPVADVEEADAVEQTDPAETLDSWGSNWTWRTRRA